MPRSSVVGVLPAIALVAACTAPVESTGTTAGELVVPAPAATVIHVGPFGQIPTALPGCTVSPGGDGVSCVPNACPLFAGCSASLIDGSLEPNAPFYTSTPNTIYPCTHIYELQEVDLFTNKVVIDKFVLYCEDDVLSQMTLESWANAVPRMSIFWGALYGAKLSASEPMLPAAANGYTYLEFEVNTTSTIKCKLQSSCSVPPDPP